MKNVMNNQVLFKFLEEIGLQCRFARFAYDSVRSSVQGFDPEKTFFYVHSLLTAAGNVSRLLWPERSESKARGERLRSELNLTEDSPLKIRHLRKSLDASDEHFEDWLGAMETPSYTDFSIMPQGTMQGYKQDTFQRSLDPDMYTLVFRGEACDLRQITDELRRIESAAQLWLKTHNPW
jgi:hypothetical protein